MIAIARRQDEISSGFRERTREILSETAAGSGDNRDSAGEIEGTATIRGMRHAFRAHETPPGVSTTFIRLGSRLCRRSNHRGPSSSGATALISGLTRIACDASSSIAFGYSPAEAQEP